MKIEKLINLLNDKQSESGMEVDYCSYLSKQGLAKAIYTEIVKSLEELQATPYNAELQLEVKNLKERIKELEGALKAITINPCPLCGKHLVAYKALKGDNNGKEKRSN